MKRHLYFIWRLRIIFPLLFICACSLKQTVIQGRVINENGEPLAGAVVRVKTSVIETLSGSDGAFHINEIAGNKPVFLTAWLPGYYINGVKEIPPVSSTIEIILKKHHETDNPEYAWLPSTFHEGEGENQGCAQCHSSSASNLPYSLPVDEWLQDAHSQSAVNPRFLTMYTGSDVKGNQSPLTRYTNSLEYGRFPLRPDMNQPYFGPGYLLDFPETSGNCAACHTPAAAINNPYGVDPTTLIGVNAEGIPCDFCHKIWDVRLNPETGLPNPNMPGVLSFEFRRPPEGHQFFAGPLDDVAPGEDTYSPLQQQSAICAPCHFGVFWETKIYNSFGEWLESPYSDPETGKVCQDCHMPPLGVSSFALPDQGGETRDPSTIFSHRMPGAADFELLQNSVTMEVETEIQNDRVVVTVTITNDKTGHHIPTDSPLRQMILLVEARDRQGNNLQLDQGSTLPDWAGIGDPQKGYYANTPGTAYAKILEEIWTNVSPSGAYWNPTRILSDNRIPAMGSDTTTYIFNLLPTNNTDSITPKKSINIKTTLLFRRAFITLMEQKQWDTPDIVMEEIIEEVDMP
jgi:hypothetical protein